MNRQRPSPLPPSLFLCQYCVLFPDKIVVALHFGPAVPLLLFLLVVAESACLVLDSGGGQVRPQLFLLLSILFLYVLLSLLLFLQFLIENGQVLSLAFQFVFEDIDILLVVLIVFS